MNNGKKTKGVMLLLVVAVILMTVGFAAYSSTLNITGNVTVKGNPWNVHFVNEGAATDIVETSGSVHATSSSINDTDFTFTVTLEKPGDFFEATINVENEGSILAYLNSITMSSISSYSNYLSYSITYNNGTTYTSTTTGITGVSLAAGGTTHPVKVRVEYKADTAQANLPTSDVTVQVTGSLNYSSQATV